MASRLTTTDNPFNPFTEFLQWDSWDRAAGYNTSSYLARIVITSEELSEPDQEEAIESAIDEIIEENGNLYKRVTEPA